MARVARQWSFVGVAVLVLFALSLLASVAKGQVVVDGDLRDLIPVAQASVSDPMNEVCIEGASGFDISNVYVYYDPARDALYIGINIMDAPPGVGRRGAGVPGDTDGDGDPDHATPEGACALPSFPDEVGVGQDEFYRIYLDTNGNGRVDEDEDVLVQYRDNRFGILNPRSMQPIPDAAGEIKLGTAGAGGVNTGIPDEDENTQTSDIEIRLDNWCQLDATPLAFEVLVWAAAYSGLPEDTSHILVNLAYDYGRQGAPVLRINDESNWSCVSIGEAIRVSLATTAAGPSAARYALWAWPDVGLGPVELIARGVEIGYTADPTPLNRHATPQPIRCLRSPDLPARLCEGVPESAGPTLAPWTITRRAGFRVPIFITLQGLIENAAATDTLGFSVTNAVTLQVHR